MSLPRTRKNSFFEWAFISNMSKIVFYSEDFPQNRQIMRIITYVLSINNNKTQQVKANPANY